jgi:integrase
VGRGGVTAIRLRYVHRFKDRHGKVRYYFRRAGFKRVPLKGEPGSAEFMAAYQAALGGEAAQPREIGASHTRPGTVAALVAAYFKSPAFTALSPSTRATYRGIIERFRAAHGDKRVATLRREDVQRMLSGKVSTPAAARNWLRMVRMLMQFAVGQGLRDDNPTQGVKGPAARSSGFHTWTEDEIAKFEAHHPIGSRARLALALLLYTAQRRGDVIRMGRQHIHGGVLRIRQQKTGTLVEIPVHATLREVLDATPSKHLTFLTTKDGKAFTAAGFTNWFRECCEAAGLPDGCSPHGLRKAAARRLAEAGCTAHEIMAITGHKTLREAQRYTEAADRAKLAKQAMQKVTTRTSSGKPS